MALLNEEFGITHGTGCIFARQLLIFSRHQSEKITRLAVVIIIVLTLIVVINVAMNFQRRFFLLGRVLPFTVAVGLVALGTAVITVYTHGTVTMVSMERATGLVYRNLFRIHSQAVTLCITIREKASLQHFVGRETDTFHYILRIESSLLYFGKVVFRVTVQFQDTYILKREIFVRPYLCKVERIDAVFVRLLFRHQLYLELPLREVTLFDALVQVALVRFTILGNDSLGLLVGQILDALQGAQMELHPNTFVGGIEKAISMTTETMHMAIGIRNTTGTHRDGHLMQSFGQQGPEIPVIVRTAHIGARVTFYGMVQIGKFQRIAQEEYRSIISH